MVSILPAPKPATLGYSTAAQIPYLSIRLSRAEASHVAGSTSDRRGGCCGGYWPHPAWAAAAAAPTRLSPKYQASSWNFSSNLTCGTLSPHFLTSRRDVHRS